MNRNLNFHSCYLLILCNNHKLLKNRRVEKISLFYFLVYQKQHFDIAATFLTLLLFNKLQPTEWCKTSKILVHCFSHSLVQHDFPGCSSYVLHSHLESLGLKITPKLLFIVKDICSLWSQDRNFYFCGGYQSLPAIVS